MDPRLLGTLSMIHRELETANTIADRAQKLAEYQALGDAARVGRADIANAMAARRKTLRDELWPVDSHA